jgi:hypothetical protein
MIFAVPRLCRALLLTSVIAAGCGSAPPPPAATPPAVTSAKPGDAASAPPTDAAASGAFELPPLLRGIGLTPAQTEQISRMAMDLDRDGGTFRSAVDAMGRSVAGAARHCKGDSPFIGADASRVVREGEAMRAPVLDAVQRLHGLLTPAQRRTVSARSAKATTGPSVSGATPSGRATSVRPSSCAPSR